MYVYDVAAVVSAILLLLQKKIKQVVAMNTHLSNDTHTHLTKGPHRSPHGYHLTNPHTGCSHKGADLGGLPLNITPLSVTELTGWETKRYPYF